MFPAYITIKLDQPRYISGLDFIPDKSAVNIVKVPYGVAKKVNIYVSMDGTNWELAGSKDNLGNNVPLKHIDFPEQKKLCMLNLNVKAFTHQWIQLLSIKCLPHLL